ncbi:gamma-glutamyl kinase [Thioclava sp. FR2]|uniref:gamma-glutamyl kinase n=1 Tax=Thioclava sp. FR2 TaxID=3445780 RepID=UPI003EBD95BC
MPPLAPVGVRGQTWSLEHQMGARVFVLKQAGLVYLANPKTATQALRAMLKPYAKGSPEETMNKHINAQAFDRRWREKAVRIAGGEVETFAVMREPMSHMSSWFRYRQREALRGHENSTYGMSFAEFVEGRLEEDQPPFARIGRQDKFLGFMGAAERPVTYVFDYDRLDLLMLFLSERLGADLAMPTRNVSPRPDDTDLTLPADLMARFREAHAGEFALYDKVQDQGVLETR